LAKVPSTGVELSGQFPLMIFAAYFRQYGLAFVIGVFMSWVEVLSDGAREKDWVLGEKSLGHF